MAKETIKITLEFFTMWRGKYIPIKVIISPKARKKAHSFTLEATSNFDTEDLKVLLIQRGIIEQGESATIELVGSLKLKDGDTIRVILPTRLIPVSA